MAVDQVTCRDAGEQHPASSMPDDGTAAALQAGDLDSAGRRPGGAIDRGGIGQHGPHTNSGWLSLLLAMMCLPFGTMLTVLGAAKWLRNRRLARAQDRRRI